MFELEWLGNSTTARSWREVESALAEIEAASRDPVAVTVIRAEAGEMMINPPPISWTPPLRTRYWRRTRWENGNEGGSHLSRRPRQWRSTGSRASRSPRSPAIWI